MNRIVVWILGIISGVLLLNGALMTGITGYGASSGCVTQGLTPQPCTPVLQQITIDPSMSDGQLSGGLVILLLAILIGLPAWVGSPILAQRRGSSARTAILVVAIIASALLIVSLVIPVLSSPALATPETCLGSGGPGATSICFYGSQAKLVALLGIGVPPVLMAVFIGMPAWVMALTETAIRKRWGWFVAVLFLSPIAAMLYGFRGAQPRPTAAPPTPVAATSGA